MAYRLSCPSARGIFLDQGLNLCPLLWQAGSQPLDHQGSPSSLFLESESEVAQSCLTLCDHMDCNPAGSLVHGIFQAWILEWVAISFSRGSSQPRDPTWVSHNVGRRFTIWATREAQKRWPHNFSVVFLNLCSRSRIYLDFLFQSLYYLSPAQLRFCFHHFALSAKLCLGRELWVVHFKFLETRLFQHWWSCCVRIPLHSVNEGKDTISPSFAHYLHVNQPTTHCTEDLGVSKELSEAQLCICYHHPHRCDSGQVLWLPVVCPNLSYLRVHGNIFFPVSMGILFCFLVILFLLHFKKETGGNAIYATITFSITGSSFSFSLNHFSA